MKVKHILATLSIIPILIFAQGPVYWKLGGNNAFPPSAVTPVNNILGTNINLPMRIHTNAIERGRWFTAGGGLAINSFGNTQVTPGSNVKYWCR